MKKVLFSIVCVFIASRLDNLWFGILAFGFFLWTLWFEWSGKNDDI